MALKDTKRQSCVDVENLSNAIGGTSYKQAAVVLEVRGKGKMAESRECLADVATLRGEQRNGKAMGNS